MNKLQLKGEMKIANRQIGEYYLTLQILKQDANFLGFQEFQGFFDGFEVL